MHGKNIAIGKNKIKRLSSGLNFSLRTLIEMDIMASANQSHSQVIYHHIGVEG